MHVNGNKNRVPFLLLLCLVSLICRCPVTSHMSIEEKFFLPDNGQCQTVKEGELRILGWPPCHRGWGGDLEPSPAQLHSAAGPHQDPWAWPLFGGQWRWANLCSGISSLLLQSLQHGCYRSQGRGMGRVTCIPAVAWRPTTQRETSLLGAAHQPAGSSGPGPHVPLGAPLSVGGNNAAPFCTDSGSLSHSSTLVSFSEPSGPPNLCFPDFLVKWDQRKKGSEMSCLGQCQIQYTS